MRLVSIFSCFLVFSVCFSQTTSSDLLSRVKNASPEQMESLLQEAETNPNINNDDALMYYLENYVNNEDKKPLILFLENRVQLEKMSNDSETSNKRIIDILSNPAYREESSKKDSNWLQRALDRLSDLFKTQREPFSNNSQNFSMPKPLDLGAIFPFIIGILIAALCFALFVAFRNVKFSKSKREKSTRRGLLDDDEPLLTYDEWLEKANALEKEGKFREAVRCLYLAILMRLDESRIIRFERTETNWEHLYRIENSLAPKEVDYKTLTKRFDLVWYGDHSCTTEDLILFRNHYQLLVDSIRSNPL